MGIVTRAMQGDINAIIELLFALKPIAFHLASAPVFNILIHQPPGSFFRWALLPPLVIGPLFSIWLANDLSVIGDGLGNVWANGAIIGLTDWLSGLYCENWYFPQWDLTAARKLWYNPRRIPYRRRTQGQNVTRAQRFFFVMHCIGTLLFLLVLNTAVQLGKTLAIFPFPKDFDPKRATYFHFSLDRQARIRAIFCLMWAWNTWIFLNVAHSFLSIIFVGILQLDCPDEWPSLYGNPLNAYSIQRFWGLFSHHIGSPSQAALGRTIARRIFPAGSRAEKTFVVFFVFLLTGLSHVLVTLRTVPTVNPMSDLEFFMANFAGGLLELLFRRLSGRNIRKSHVGLGRRILGYLWVFVFFYVIVPPWQWPALKQNVERIVPDIRIKIVD